MKQVYNGSGTNTTASLLTWLLAHKVVWTGHLFAIGIGGFGTAFPTTSWQYFMTDLAYPVKPSFVPSPFAPGSSIGSPTFRPSRIKRGTIHYGVGLDATTADIEWHPQDKQIVPESTLPTGITVLPPYADAFNAQPSTGTVWETFRAAFLAGQLEQAYMCIWRLYMQYPNDVNSFGSCVLFNGRIADCTIDRQTVRFTLSSFLEYFATKLPTQLIQPQNRGISYGYGQTVAVALATLQAGTNKSTLILNQPGGITAGQLNEGMAQISINPSASTSAPLPTTLWRQIRTNAVQAGSPGTVTVYLYEPLPLTPTAGADQASFYLPLSALDSGRQQTLGNVPAVAPYTITVATNPPGFVDYGVLYGSTVPNLAGLSLVKVSSNPGQGQYSVFNGIYTFNAADTGRQVSISWGSNTGSTAVGSGFPYVPIPETAF